MTPDTDSDPALISARARARACTERLRIAAEARARELAAHGSCFGVRNRSLEQLLVAAFLAGSTWQVIDDINHARPRDPVSV